MKQYDYVIVRSGSLVGLEELVRGRMGEGGPVIPGTRWVCQGGVAVDAAGWYQAMVLWEPTRISERPRVKAR